MSSTERVCAKHPDPGSLLSVTVAEVSGDALCAQGICPPTLEQALAHEYCSSATEGCGLVQVRLYVPGFVFVDPIYDASTGARVGAYAQTNEAYTRQIDGCCAEAFTAGPQLSCGTSTPRACTPP